MVKMMMSKKEAARMAKELVGYSDVKVQGRDMGGIIQYYVQGTWNGNGRVYLLTEDGDMVARDPRDM